MDVEWNGEAASVEELDGMLRRCVEVPRAMRRRMVSDARLMSRRLVDVDGCAPGSVRFKVIRCDCCGCLEMTGSGDFARRRVCH